MSSASSFLPHALCGHPVMRGQFALPCPWPRCRYGIVGDALEVPKLLRHSVAFHAERPDGTTFEIQRLERDRLIRWHPEAWVLETGWGWRPV